MARGGVLLCGSRAVDLSTAPMPGHGGWVARRFAVPLQPCRRCFGQVPALEFKHSSQECRDELAVLLLNKTSQELNLFPQLASARSSRKVKRPSQEDLISSHGAAEVTLALDVAGAPASDRILRRTGALAESCDRLASLRCPLQVASEHKHRWIHVALP